MQSRPSRWACEPYDTAAAAALRSALGLSPTLATILVRRGFGSVDQARRFLASDERHDPFGMAGMRAACELILSHVERRSSIVVYGDYDVDGVCSTAMLLRALRRLGAQPAWELPSRFDDGYGLSLRAVERLSSRGAELLITVDTGITAVEEVAAARAAGLDVVVTDHHRPGARLPETPIVHPVVGGYACADLCASGVVLKMAEALHTLTGVDPSSARDDLDLAALATVCDLVPLLGENRHIVREGLEALRRTDKPGLRALMSVAAVAPGEISEQALGFRLGPRLNAAGRMQRADAALELLMTEDEARADAVAHELDLLNRDRQEAETRILFAADAACATQASQAAMVVAGEGWHPGVVGIVASRLVERWGRPCVVVALDAEGGRGSGRSTPAYDLHAGLAACQAELRRFGGHRAAAGVELDPDRVDSFRRGLATHAATVLAPADLLPVERVDAVVPGSALGLGLADELEQLRPFGAGNPAPTLLVPAAGVEAVAGMGDERQHARFVIVAGGGRARGVAFGSPPTALERAGGAPHDLAVRLEPNRWNGVVEPRVVLRALCRARPGRVRDLGEEQPFWTLLERQLEDDAAAEPPSTGPPRELRDRRREGFAGVAGDLLTSGDSVLVAVADVSRRRASLAERLGALAPDGLAVVSWEALAYDPSLADGFDHLLALDPPPCWPAVPAAGRGVAHLAWGPAEAEFALAAWRAELDLRSTLADAYSALRRLERPAGQALERVLRGAGRHPRSATCCGRIVRVLAELRLLDYTPLAAGGPACRLLEVARTELDRSPAFRSCRMRLASLERALAPELAGAVTELAGAVTEPRTAAVAV